MDLKVLFDRATKLRFVNEENQVKGPSCAESLRRGRCYRRRRRVLSDNRPIDGTFPEKKAQECSNFTHYGLIMIP